MLLALVSGGVEGLSVWLGDAFRWPLYLGAAACLALSAVGLPFALKLSRLPLTPASSARFWRLWGLGVLLRLFLIAGLTFALLAHFAARGAPAVLAMALLYLVGMFAESGWLARRLWEMDEKAHG